MPSLDLTEVRNGYPLAKHLHTMGHPDEWPGIAPGTLIAPGKVIVLPGMAGVLPLKKCGCGQDEVEHACRQARLSYMKPERLPDGSVRPLVWLGSPLVPREPEGLAWREYESLEAILADGWGVD